MDALQRSHRLVSRDGRIGGTRLRQGLVVADMHHRPQMRLQRIQPLQLRGDQLRGETRRGRPPAPGYRRRHHQSAHSTDNRLKGDGGGADLWPGT